MAEERPPDHGNVRRLPPSTAPAPRSEPITVRVDATTDPEARGYAIGEIAGGLFLALLGVQAVDWLVRLVA